MEKELSFAIAQKRFDMAVQEFKRVGAITENILNILSPAADTCNDVVVIQRLIISLVNGLLNSLPINEFPRVEYCHPQFKFETIDWKAINIKNLLSNAELSDEKKFAAALKAYAIQAPEIIHDYVEEVVM